ncbi:hypothetical protein DRQ15_05535 [candidate division KSB1 bacterium]|nr:hypothetical protein [bacterium]RKY77225.1 MAG: hypothetical protein DRQ12_08665 [candidate division KSB1 bacterium]HDI51473.1 hypothetical protein [Bacteroidota bacterium]RKY78062.1 MAG: hypothetical protein DRQ00_05900 [candidate division KSB1 bacterium]RKY86396.1 MAG: hypothetical protein DRP98_00530 [candidate division KSB1 bacterium]
MIVKTFTLKHVSPQEILRRVHSSGIIGYLFNWGYSIDETQQSITFTIRHGGGSFEEEEQKVAKALEDFISAIDVERSTS